jgi:flagellin
MSRINTNVPALTAIRQLNANNRLLSKSLERLSSGLRINRGADDPAGLIASESLRSEIRGLDAAIANSERAINVVSTTDAALGEISKLLLDIKGLVVQTANDGALSDAEIEANQLQVDSLLNSINRIANTTQFNGKKLLNGNLSYTVDAQDTTKLSRLQVFGANVPTGSTLPVTVQVTQSAQTALLTITSAQAGLSGTVLSNAITIEVQGSLGTETFSFAAGTATSAIASAIIASKNSIGVSASLSNTGSTLKFNSTKFGSEEFVSVRTISGSFDVQTPAGSTGSVDFELDKGRNAAVIVNGQAASVRSGFTASIRNSGLDLVLDLSQSFGTSAPGASTTFSVTGGGANFQIGPNVDPDGRISIGITSTATTNLGSATAGFLNALGSTGSSNLLDSTNLPVAEDIISAAISQVSTLSGRLGGFQANQVETNLNSLRVALENVTASESSIRDTDFSAEVARLTRAQILQQSTTQILGLANQIPQSVLSLLR